MAVEEISVEGKELVELVELDYPSSETLFHWNVELTATPVREWLLKRLPGKWPPFPADGARWPERSFTWEVARRLAEQARFQGLKYFSVILQRARLALMTRYAAA